MSSGKKQYEMENEPVARHLSELRMKENGKETFGLLLLKQFSQMLLQSFIINIEFQQNYMEELLSLFR